MDNPQLFAGQDRHRWGITAADGLGFHTIKVSGIVIASRLLDLLAIALVPTARKGGV
jgi:hypothetical protein